MITSHETHGRMSGNAIILGSMVGQWLIDHGLSTAMVWIAILGLLLNVFTGLPAIARSFALMGDWFHWFVRKVK